MSEQSLPISEKEYAKVVHEINNRWHTVYKGKRNCMIVTHSNQHDSPAYKYDFINYGFNEYVIFRKSRLEE